MPLVGPPHDELERLREPEKYLLEHPDNSDVQEWSSDGVLQLIAAGLKENKLARSRAREAHDIRQREADRSMHSRIEDEEPKGIAGEADDIRQRDVNRLTHSRIEHEEEIAGEADDARRQETDRPRHSGIEDEEEMLDGPEQASGAQPSMPVM